MGCSLKKYCENDIPNTEENKDVPKYVPQIKKGRVIKVYDGDTITIVGYIKNNRELFKFSVRLNGLDCPEIKSKKSIDKTEYNIACLARNFVSKLLLNKIIYLENVSLDKYGRLLCDVYLDKQNINNTLLKNRLAVPYDGKTKISPKNWELYHLHGKLI